MNRKDRCGGVATLRSKVLTILRLAGMDSVHGFDFIVRNRTVIGL